MAEVLLSFAIEETVKKVGSLVVEGISLAWGFKGKLEKLKESLDMIEAVIQDAERRQITEAPVRRWLEKLLDVAHDADDVLDDLSYEILRQKVQIRNNHLMGKVGSFFSLSNPIAFRLSMALKIEKINESLDGLDREASRSGLKRLSAIDRTPPELISLDRETDLFINSLEVVIGRDYDVSEVVDLLTSSSVNQEALSVIPIVGMGGLGKTTLAKLVWKAVEERKLFEKMIWICVSEDFNNKRILGGMLQTVEGSSGSVAEKDEIIRRLKGQLEMKNFLLVLDDVWNEDDKKWDSLKESLLKINGTERSVVIVTTRSKRVASIMETSPDCRHNLKQMSDVECWSIIKRIVSRNEVEPIPSELEAIGMDVANKCGGVPLAAKVLGGMLLSNKEKEKWMSIKNSDAFDALKDDGTILPLLKLSFDRLPSPSLKRCFAYCSIFSKDFEIEKEQLIHLWMAEGLVRPSHERQKDTMEDIGEEYFNDLVARSFFQDVERSWSRNTMICKMHDLVHGVALLVSKPETFILESDSTIDGLSRVRYLNLIRYVEVDESAFLNVRKLHTLFSRVDVLKSWKFKSLRTLNLNGADIKVLPTSINKLKHLRYLDASETSIKAFPESITSLYHLQTLRASACQFLHKLPKEMKNLVSLRHLFVPKGCQMLAHLGCLVSLVTLHPSMFVVGPDKGYKIEELGSLKELRGKLEILKLELVRDKQEAERANMCEKEKINELVLQWSSGRESNSCSMYDDDVLEGLQAHPDLRSLEIKCYLGERLPKWLSMPRVNNLVELKLKDCSNFKQLPPLGHLLCLEIHELDGMKGVSCIGKEFYGDSDRLFPALKKFSLKDMGSIVEWTVPDHAAEIFPCLEELYIENCPKLNRIPSMIHPSSELKSVKIYECDSLSHVSVDFLASSSFRDFEFYVRGRPASIPGIECGSAVKILDINSKEYSWGNRYLRLGNYRSRLFSFYELRISSDWSLSYSLEDFFRCLTQLEELDIKPLCKEMEEYPKEILSSIHHLSGSLESLSIRGWSKLKGGIPYQLQHLTALKQLHIYNFNRVEALPDWLGNLSSLIDLRVAYCKDLKYLPSSPAMHGLSNLHNLTICGCPLLEENCRKNSGPEWPKISHIPCIIIHK